MIKLASMRTLILGGTGLIGGHAALYLKQRGHQVTISGRQRQLPSVFGLADLPFVYCDYLDDSMTGDWLGAFDAIVFAAGHDPRHVPEGEDATKHLLFANGIGIPRFARLARSAGVSCFVHIGSFYPHVVPSLVDSVPYIRSRKLAVDGVLALNSSTFCACSLDAPVVVGSVPGLQVPFLKALVEYAKGDLDVPVFAPQGGTNFMSTRSLSEAIAGALNAGPTVGGKAFLVGDENLEYAAFFQLFFHALNRSVVVPALDQDHPLLPRATLYSGNTTISYEPNPQETALLGNYERGDIRQAVSEVVFQYNYEPRKA